MEEQGEISYKQYENEQDLPGILSLIEKVFFSATIDFCYACLSLFTVPKELSEPYSVFTYRYFLNNWPELALLVRIHFVEKKMNYRSFRCLAWPDVFRRWTRSAALGASCANLLPIVAS